MWTGAKRLLRSLPPVLLVVALAVAWLLTLVWLVAPSNPLGVVVTTFTYAALPCALLAVLLLPLVAVRSDGYRLPAVSAVALLPLLMFQIVHFAPLFVGDAGRTVPGRATVMTLNAHRGLADASEIVAAVRDHDVDVLTVLETTPRLRDELDEAGLDELLPYRVDNMWGEPGGRITYADEPLEEVTRFEEPLFGHVLTVGQGADAFTYVAVHIARPLRDDARDWTAAQARLRVRLAQTSGPVVVAGDFGATLDHKPMRELADAGLTDSVVATDGGFKPTWPAAGSHKILGITLPPLIQIDHVLGNKQVEFHSSSTLTIDGTDHKAVLADFGIRS